MTTIDLFVATYLGWAFYRGRHRGFRAETARIVGLLLTLAFFLGFGLLSVVRNGLGTLADNLLQRRGIVVTVLVLLAAVLIVVLFHISLRRRSVLQCEPLLPACPTPIANAECSIDNQVFVTATDMSQNRSGAIITDTIGYPRDGSTTQNKQHTEPG